jgi:hypothetical protein
MTRRGSAWLIVAVTATTVAVVFLLPRIPQSSEYHHFADHRSLLGIPSCLNVISNLPFLWVGALSLLFLWRDGAREAPRHFIQLQERQPYAVFFLGVALTAFGSAYYHLAPTNARLFWDRLPMTLGFMSFLAAMIAERASVSVGLRMLWPLVVVGAASVVYWELGEQRGAGDLRPYAIVQFYPVLAIALLALLYPARYTRTADLLLAVGFYALAKICEMLDAPIFTLGSIVSGHTLKHLAASLACYWILRMLKLRTAQASR